MEDHPDFLAVVMSDGYAPVRVFIVDPSKKGHRVHKVLIKMAFVGDHIRRQRGIAILGLFGCWQQQVAEHQAIMVCCANIVCAEVHQLCGLVFVFF